MDNQKAILAEWVKCKRKDLDLRRAVELARGNAEDNQKRLEGYESSVDGVGPNIPEKYVETLVDGEKVVVCLRWVSYPQKPREGKIQLSIVEIE